MTNTSTTAAALRGGGFFWRRSGFTLVEIMLVVLLIGLLFSIGGFSVIRARRLASIKEAGHELAMIAVAVEKLAWDTGCWPGGKSQSITKELNDSGVGTEITDLTATKAGLLEQYDYTNWRGPYLTDIPVDPWGTPYWFDPDYRTDAGDIAAVGSSGPNKSGANAYDDDNVYIDVTHIYHQAHP